MQFIRQKTRTKSIFAEKSEKKILGRGFLTWVGRVTRNTNIFFSWPYKQMYIGMTRETKKRRCI